MGKIAKALNKDPRTSKFAQKHKKEYKPFGSQACAAACAVACAVACAWRVHGVCMACAWHKKEYVYYYQPFHSQGTLSHAQP